MEVVFPDRMRSAAKNFILLSSSEVISKALGFIPAEYKETALKNTNKKIKLTLLL